MLFIFWEVFKCSDAYVFCVCLNPGSHSSVLEGRCPADFSSKPNQTHLKLLIKLGILETFRQVCENGWS